jgi:peroxiredoxin
MRKAAIVAGVLVVILAVAAGWFWRVNIYAGAPAPPPQVALGQAVADFTLPDLDGNQHSLSSLKGEKGALLVWISPKCPYSRGYDERMQAVHRDYAGRGIRFIAINSNRNEPSEELKAYAAQKGWTFTILKDEGNRVADFFGASVTPEAYLLDAGLVLRYHGRLDANHEDPSLNSHELREAMDAMLAGQQIANTGKKAFGCTIKRVTG